MTRLVVAVEPTSSGHVLTLEHGDGFREELHAAALPGCSDEFLAHAVEVEQYPNPATNWARVRTLTGDWFDVSRLYAVTAAVAQ